MVGRLQSSPLTSRSVTTSTADAPLPRTHSRSHRQLWRHRRAQARGSPTNPLAIVALVFAIIGEGGGVSFLVYFLSTPPAHSLSWPDERRDRLVGVIFMCCIAAVLGAVANGQISRSAGRQTGGTAVTFAYLLSTVGVAAAVASFVVVGSAS